MAEVTIPLGPQHPALKEPAGFDITLEGEKVVRMVTKVGYNHRGMEKACEARTWIQCLYLLERVCGICSQAHTTCYAQAVEDVAGLVVPKRALYIRALIGELERIHSHLLWLGVAGHEIGFDTLLMYSWRDRELVMDTLTALSGNRVNYAMNCIGGVRRDITPEQIAQTLAAVDTLEERTKYYIELAETEVTLAERLSGVGTLTPGDAERLGACGPTGRASGVDRDVRRDDPYACYGELDFRVITDNHCDVYGRTLVRLGELMETYGMIRQILKRMPDGPIAVRAPRKVPAGEAFSRYEAPRGEDVHYVKSTGGEKPDRVKVRAPTLANVQAVAKMMENQYLADMPIVLAAIDPCFSCTDRAIRLRGDSALGEGLHSWEDLRRYSIAWHKARGFDPSKLRLR